MGQIHTSELATLQDVNGNYAAESANNPDTLCANWRYGCNRTTDGPDGNGFLTPCDDCGDDEE